MQDWDYTAAGCMDLTLELSQDKYPAASTLSTQWSDNLNPLLALPITSVLGGVSGQVLNGAGNPIKGATVTIDGSLMKGAARGPLAYYNRPLAPGSYTVRVQAPGYRGASATVTVPANGQGVKQDFKLEQSRREPGGSSAVAVEAGERVP
jgi:carboxypeptidase D